MNKKEIIINFIKENIKQGKYKPGSKIMSENMMIEYLGVTRYCVREAIIDLCKEGIVEKKQGSGSYITDKIGEKYIIIAITEFDYFNQSGKFFSIFIERMKEEISNMGYKAVITLLDSNKKEDTDIFKHINQKPEDAIGLINISNDKTYSTLEERNIPIIQFIGETSPYPFIKFDLFDYLTTTKRLLDIYKLNNIQVYTYPINSYSSLYQIILKDLFGKDLIEIPQEKTNKTLATKIEKHIKNIKTPPDAIVFLDNTLYSACQTLFPTYNILKNTKIITHSNNDEQFPENYDIC
ncbi:MAG: GntR family transcriptional regulator, partial [Abditibacteriota bacterium]|nr:GntR family transcriptional regulator [Abditibacteriota bacterium]